MSSAYLRRVVVGVVVAVLGLVLPASALAGTGPAVVGAVSNSTSLSGVIGVAVSGHYAFTTAYWPGQLTVVDISTPTSPQVVGSTTTNATQLQNGSTVAISGHYAFVVSKNRNASASSNDDGSGNSLTIVDISTPTDPTVVGTVRDPNKLFGAYGIAVQGNYAYVAYQGLLSSPQPQTPDTSAGGFSVIDISTPTGPTIVANIDNSSLTGSFANGLNHATAVAISPNGHYAYVTSFNRWKLTVVNISNPTSPSVSYVLSDGTHLQWPNYVTVVGNYAYVANQAASTVDQFTILSLLNQAQPVVVGSLSNSVMAGAYRVRVRGNFAYVAANSTSSVAAIDISNPSSPRLAASITDAAHLNQTSDLDIDSTGRYVIANSSSQPGQSGGKYPPFTYTTGTISVIDMIPNPIAVPIASEPPSTTTSSSATFAFAADDDVSTVACSLDGAAYNACTSQTTQSYSGLGIGSHTFKVQATDAAGDTSTSTYTWTVGTAPQAGSPGPSVSGATVVGQTLTASSGLWSGFPAPSYTYQWAKCDQNGQNCGSFGSATSSNTYTLLPSDAGSTFEVTVTASNSLGSSQATSSATGVVQGAGAAPTNTSLPSISPATPAVGQPVIASSGSWSGNPSSFTYSYQWQRCSGASCVSVGSNTASYTPQAADAGSTIQVLVTASNGVPPAGQATSAATSAVTEAPTGGSPSLAGTSTQNQTLTASPGSWNGYPSSFTYAYQWQRCDQNGQNCGNIGTGATTYTLQRADVGQTIRVLVTATNGSGSSSPTPSTVTARVAGPPVNSSLPAVSGTDVQGSTLTATAGTWTGYPAPGFSYEWQRCPTNGEGCTMISTDRGTKYTLTAADVGYSMRIYVQAQNSAGYQPARSAGTAVVQSNTSASITGLFTTHAKLVMRSQTPGSKITTLRLSLGGGLGFSTSPRVLARALSVTDSAGRRIPFNVKLGHGTLVLTLKRAVSKVRVTVTSDGLILSGHIVRSQQKHSSHLTLTVVLSETGNRSARDRIQLPLH